MQSVVRHSESVACGSNHYATSLRSTNSSHRLRGERKHYVHQWPSRHTKHQTLKASANLTACANLAQLLGAVPTNLSWQGTAYEVQCTSPTGNSADPGTGIVTWNDNQDPSSIELVSFTNSNLDGGAVTVATFRVTAGRLAGTTFTAENAFVPALNQLNCSDQNPEYEIQGEGIGEDILGLL